MFEKEKKQYNEDCKTHERPWELWQSALVMPGSLNWIDLYREPNWSEHCVYRRKQTTFMPEYYSGLNWRDAEHLIGKTVECTNNHDYGWKSGLFKLTMAHKSGYHFGVNVAGQTEFYISIRTCEKTFKHPTINIGGIELPKPETVAPELGAKYWLSPTCTEMYWCAAPYDISELNSCRVHLTEERAKAWTDWWKNAVVDKMK